MEIRDPLMRRRFQRLRALVLDVDGVLTDGGMYYGPSGEVMKKFNARDGMGISMLIEAGLRVAFITGESTEISLRRAEKLGVEDVYLGVEDKGAALEDFLGKHGLAAEDVAYVGDDLNDLPCLRKAGVGIAVADAAAAVRKAAHLVTERRGGEGAVREIAEAILAGR
ncbi:MAG: HAD hydrolase family protein [Planctomycetes bacterium]|nr:HAD hydrolase family protein [Planctomycetota bacterium]